jgi:hypothetical protein
MKKTLVIVLALVFVLSIAGTAFAASNPFVDVPAKHWAYDAVSKLAKAGIIDGMGDGTFQGNKNMTRYEMAQIVAKAMARSEKADAANKALIDKLAVEFAKELNNLGVRVAKLENKTNIGLTYESRIRAQQAEVAGTKIQEGTNMWDARQRIYFAGAVNENVTFGARLEGSGTFGTGSWTTSFNRAFFNVKDFLGAVDQLTIGKFSTLGITPGLLNGKTSNNDGFIAAKKLGDDVTFKWAHTVQAPTVEVNLYNFDFKAGTNVNFNLGYQTADSIFKSIDFGAIAKVGEMYVTGEYVSTKIDLLNLTQKAYALQITNGTNGYFYPVTAKIVDINKPQTDAFALIYRKVDAGATPVMSAFASNTPGFASDNNIKGYELVYQNVVSKGITFTAEYHDYKTVLVPQIKEKYWAGYLQFYF